MILDRDILKLYKNFFFIH